MSKYKLVWSDDPKDKLKPQDHTPVVIKNNFTAVFRIEKGGRAGKTVTVIDGLPKHETYLKELCKELKAKCGSGGTYFAREGRIEIQGDKREEIKKIFNQKGISFKGM